MIDGPDGSDSRPAPGSLSEYRSAVADREATVAAATGHAPAPRLARHVLTLDDGHEVTVAVAGRGVPFVVVHGFMAEGFMYAQTLSRLVALGYKVVAIDTAGHGGTEVLPDAETDFDSYVELFSRTLDHLGIHHAVLTGHSMGGRVVAELAADEPERAVALLLIDPILGRQWDRMVAAARVFPPLLGWLGFLIAVDTASTFPVLRDRSQARKLVRLLAPTVLRHVRRPWHLLAPAIAILRSGSSRPVLDRVRRHGIPTVVVHGERDFIVPLATARDAAERTGGDLVIVHGATHSWCLKDPETLPAVVQALWEARLHRAYDDALREHGVDPDAPIDDIEAAFYDESARVLALTPELTFERSDEEVRSPRYHFSVVEAEPGPGEGQAGLGVA
ncbi:MAG: alpha/beta hydrolase [Actinobacteria bacterium]|nr:alpha/beta hydrolase [Actinomycetota bacterium]